MPEAQEYNTLPTAPSVPPSNRPKQTALTPPQHITHLQNLDFPLDFLLLDWL